MTVGSAPRRLGTGAVTDMRQRSRRIRHAFLKSSAPETESQVALEQGDEYEHARTTEEPARPDRNPFHHEHREDDRPQDDEHAQPWSCELLDIGPRPEGECGQEAQALPAIEVGGFRWAGCFKPCHGRLRDRAVGLASRVPPYTVRQPHGAPASHNSRSGSSERRTQNVGEPGGACDHASPRRRSLRLERPQRRSSRRPARASRRMSRLRPRIRRLPRARGLAARRAASRGRARPAWGGRRWRRS